METIEDTFAYDLAIPISRRKQGDIKWYIIEKGIKKEQRKYLYYFSASRIRSALFDIREHIIKTPLVKGIEIKCDSNVTIFYYKQELTQIMNGVQARGVIYTLLQLSDEQKRKGVIAISTGYFAHTLCYFGKKFGIPVTVVMPSSTAREIVVICRDLLATVIVQGDNMIDVHKIALLNARTKGLLYLDRNDHPNMIIGQATLGIEMFEQITEFDVIVIPTTIDGCGISAGIAIVAREWNPNIKIIEIQPEPQDSFIDDIRKITTDPNELDIPSRYSEAYVNFKTIQKDLFDLTVFLSQTDVQREADRVQNEDYYVVMAICAVKSDRLKNLVTGKRVVILLFGKTDSIMSFRSYRSSLEPRAGPSTSSS